MIGLSLSAVLISTGCRNSSLDNGSGEKIAFEQQSFQRILDQCLIDSTPCAQVEATFPQAVQGPAAACQKINDTLLFQVRFGLALFSATVEDIPGDLEAIAEQFFAEYRTMKADNSGYFIPWKVATTAKVLFQSPKIVSIQLDNYAFAGGAHPNTQTTLFNFDSQTGDIVHIDELIADRGELEKIVESAFKEVHHIDMRTSVKQSGFFWGEPFHLPDNFAILEEGLYFFYNPYEVATYAAGPTDFTISYEKLEGVVIKDRIF